MQDAEGSPEPRGLSGTPPDPGAIRGRFEGVARLYTAAGLARLQRAHVCVVGIGGVGSWTVEALARSGVGRLTLVDLDEVCVSNVNRQLHALDGTIGRAKVDVMAERVRAIHPGAEVHARAMFFTESTAEELLAPAYDYVVDAIDSTPKKCLMIARCRERGLPILTVGAAGGRRDGTALRVADLARSTHDRLLEGVRSRLRRDFGFPRGGASFGVDCVYSVEPAVVPESETEAEACGPREPGMKLACEGGYGSACHVTGAFGLAAAGHVVAQLARVPAAG
jgi:tRNA A37 threonylcarbamoyladenosine dehydratase